MIKLTSKKGNVVFTSEVYNVAHLSRIFAFRKGAFTAECDGYEWNGKEFIKIVEVKKKATKKDADKRRDITED